MHRPLLLVIIVVVVVDDWSCPSEGRQRGALGAAGRAHGEGLTWWRRVREPPPGRAADPVHDLGVDVEARPGKPSAPTPRWSAATADPALAVAVAVVRK